MLGAEQPGQDTAGTVRVLGSGELVHGRGLGARVLGPVPGVQPVGTDPLLPLCAGRWHELPEAATGGRRDSPRRPLTRQVLCPRSSGSYSSVRDPSEDRSASTGAGSTVAGALARPPRAVFLRARRRG